MDRSDRICTFSSEANPDAGSNGRKNLLFFAGLAVIPSLINL
jgi:hypothetical protein